MAVEEKGKYLPLSRIKPCIQPGASHFNDCVRFDVIRLVKIHTVVCCAVTPCIRVPVFHKNILPPSSEGSTRILFILFLFSNFFALWYEMFLFMLSFVSFLIWFMVYPVAWGRMLLHNVGTHPSHYTLSQPRTSLTGLSISDIPIQDIIQWRLFSHILSPYLLNMT